MSDNLRRYRAIRDALTHAYPTPPTGNFARHLQTLAALISGIVGSKSTQLPHIATKVPMAPSPRAGSNALPDGSTTSASWRRCTFYRMRISCSVIAPSRPWCSSWMAALWGMGAMP